MKGKGGDMTSKSSSTKAEIRIRTLIENLAHALRGKDAAGVLSHYAANKVQFLLAPPLQYTGANGIDQDSLEEWFSSFQGPIGYEIHDLSVTTGEDVAFCHSLNRMSGTKRDGEETDIWIRWTVCLRKMGGKWKITHEHESVPFYMDGSYKAAVDLKP
jgi:ketosteroid isomerase-like protein